MNRLKKDSRTRFALLFFLFTMICLSLLIVDAVRLKAEATDPPQPRLLEPVDFLDANRPKLVTGQINLWARDEEWRTDSVIDSCRFEFFDTATSAWTLINIDADPLVSTESSTEQSSQRNWWGITWNTASVPNGPCEVRVKMYIDGNYAIDTMEVYVDHNPPDPKIAGVQERQAVSGIVELGCEFTAEDIETIKWEYQPKDFSYVQGIPDMDQHDAGRPNDGEAYAAPTAHAASLTWWAEEYPSSFGGLIKKSDTTTMTEDELIAGLAEAMGTGSSSGTSVLGQIDGLREWIKTHGGGLSVSGPKSVTPESYRNEIENKGSVTIGIYLQNTGHRVTGNAIANYRNPDGTNWVDFMDPYIGDIAPAKLAPDGKLTFEGEQTVFTVNNMITVSPSEPLTPWTLIDENTITEWNNAGGIIEWDTNNLDPGMYFLKVTLEDSAGNIGSHQIAVLVKGGDYDEDGLPDDWEMYFLLDPTDDGSINPDNGPYGDPDRDGKNNYSELMTGTNPRQAPQPPPPPSYPGYLFGGFPFGGFYGGGFPFGGGFFGGFYGGGFPFGGFSGGFYGGFFGSRFPFGGFSGSSFPYGGFSGSSFPYSSLFGINFP